MFFDKNTLAVSKWNDCLVGKHLFLKVVMQVKTDIIGVVFALTLRMARLQLLNCAHSTWHNVERWTPLRGEQLFAYCSVVLDELFRSFSSEPRSFRP